MRGNKDFYNNPWWIIMVTAGIVYRYKVFLCRLVSVVWISQLRKPCSRSKAKDMDLHVLFASRMKASDSLTPPRLEKHQQQQQQQKETSSIITKFYEVLPKHHCLVKPHPLELNQCVTCCKHSAVLPCLCNF